MRYLTEFLGKDKNIEILTLDDLKGYLLMLKKRPRKFNEKFKPKVPRPITTVTIQTYVIAVRAFIGWLFDEGYIKEDLRKGFTLTKKAIEILPDEEIEKIIEVHEAAYGNRLEESLYVCPDDRLRPEEERSNRTEL